jgi:hypothetical protein
MRKVEDSRSEGGLGQVTENRKKGRKSPAKEKIWYWEANAQKVDIKFFIYYTKYFLIHKKDLNTPSPFFHTQQIFFPLLCFPNFLKHAYNE